MLLLIPALIALFFFIILAFDTNLTLGVAVLNGLLIVSALVLLSTLFTG